MDSLIRDTAERIFRDLQDKPTELWQAMQDNGLTRAWTPEELGGSGLSMADGIELIRLSGGLNSGLPFAESLLASYLLSTAGLETPDGQLSVCCSTDIAACEVPYAETVRYVVRLHESKVEYFSVKASGPEPGVGIDPIAMIDFTDLAAIQSAQAPKWMTLDVWQQLGALTRSAQLCGAMTRSLELCLEHTATREQFGRPLAKFQAIQHLLAEMAGETAASSAALQAAAQSASLTAAPDFIAVACAKARASEAAGIVAAHAIQTHGAIGYTDEYALSNMARRLWKWREDFGNESYWNERLGRHFSRAKSAGLTADVFGSLSGKG